MWVDHGGRKRWYEPCGRGSAHVGAFADGDTTEPPQPKAKTSYPPGSEGRVDVMAERARRGEAIWHRDDCLDFEEWFTTHTEPPPMAHCATDAAWLGGRPPKPKRNHRKPERIKMKDEEEQMDSEPLGSTEPCVACQDCGDVVPVRRAYFTGVDGRSIANAVCRRCHEDAVRRKTVCTDRVLRRIG